MEEFDYEDVLDETQDQYDAAGELQDAQLDNYEASLPSAKEQSSIYTWFWKVARLKKPTQIIKVGNLDKAEIGDHGVSVRDAINLSNLGHIFHHETFGDYWAQRAVTNSASSMAKKGWFMDLSISQKRVRERQKGSSPLTKQKWRMFNRNQQQTEQ